MTLLLRRPLFPDASPAREPVPSLAMPDQDIAAPFRDPNAPGIRSDRRTKTLRAVTVIVPACVTLLLGWLSLGWFALDGIVSVVEASLIAMTVFAFYWVALSATTAALGLLWRPTPLARPLFGLRTAILLPMYGETAHSTIGNAAALLAALHGEGRHRFSLHVLSDTRDEALALLEEATVAAARTAHSGSNIQYRRRDRNDDYKSGNIRDWVETAGHAYDAMLVLDADSVMGARTVMQMADALVVAPGVGLIQTIPRVLPGRTLWQGMQHFASEVYGRNIGRGFAICAGAEGNFLGHNALVRVRAFAASAGLPHLPGPAPRGGVILSHDFVEAALLRRAGWGVRMMPEAEDSFEDTPETLVGYLRRDRRWCQGNMQHLSLITAAGLHPMSRFHMLQGVMGYLSSVWWVVLLVLGALLSQNHPVDAAGEPLFITQGGIAIAVGLMLLAPKLIGIVSHLRQHGLGFDEAPRFAAALLTEVVLSALLAPVLMVHQVRAVLRTFGGLSGGWMPHVAGQSDLRTLARFHATETVLGLGLLALSVAGVLSPWLLPIAVSLTLAVPLAALVQIRSPLFGRLDLVQKHV